MKKWLRFFFLSFFSHKIAKEGEKRGYIGVFLGFLLVLMFLWVGFVGGDMLPFGTHYKNAPDFMATVRGAFANADLEKRIAAKIEDGVLLVKNADGTYAEGLLVNTFDRAADRESYSINGYQLVIDTRPADTLGEVIPSCVSNDGKNTVISYEEYLTLSDVAKLNFDFQLEYTGNALSLDGETVAIYREYINGLAEEKKSAAEELDQSFAEKKISREEYFRGIYELYFSDYYPEITAYESTSKVPLLRNYYQHQYISSGVQNYLFIFDDYMTGSFETKNGMDVSFYGFYSDIENGALIADGMTQDQANASVDRFILSAFQGIWFLYAYSYAMNVFSLAPVIALMLMVAALFAYSVLKLRGVESVRSLGAMFKIIGSFAWTSGFIATGITLVSAFFVKPGMTSVLQFVLLFVVLMLRAILFVIGESRRYERQMQQENAINT